MRNFLITLYTYNVYVTLHNFNYLLARFPAEAQERHRNGKMCKFHLPKFQAETES